jgi:hypothetical protein
MLSASRRTGRRRRRSRKRLGVYGGMADPLLIFKIFDKGIQIRAGRSDQGRPPPLTNASRRRIAA